MRGADKAVVVVMFVIAVVGIMGALHACGAESGVHRGKWTERCRHMKCESGKAEWWHKDDADSCVCVTRAKP